MTFNEILVLNEAVVTKPALFVVTVKNDIRNLLATLVKPPPAAFTVRHRFFTILWQTAVTVELYFFHSCPLTSHHFGRKGGHLSTPKASQKMLPHFVLIIPKNNPFVRAVN